MAASHASIQSVHAHLSSGKDRFVSHSDINDACHKFVSRLLTDHWVTTASSSGTTQSCKACVRPTPLRSH